MYGLEYVLASPSSQTRLTYLGLCNPYAEHPFLRDVLGYKHPWVYYIAMILDPILRFNWIFYAIYSNELQHSALLSFFVGFSEVCRRGMWTLFRVENEHCTNVGRFRASRDVPLPYEITPPTPPSPEETSIQGPVEGQTAPSPAWYSATQVATTSNLEAQQPSAGSSLRRRGAVPHNTPIQRGIARVGTMMGEAHAQDFERKRRPGTSVPASPYQHGTAGAGAESSDEEEDDEEVVDPEQEEEGGAGAGQEEDEADNARDVQSAENIMRRHRNSDA